MRKVHLWRDSENRVYAEDNATNDRFTFMHYAAAATDNAALQEIVAEEMISDLEDFRNWLAGADVRNPFDLALNEG